MRICSLIPGATEVIAALGLADRLVGISHECDFPDSVRHAPVMVEPAVGTGHDLSADIDRQVKEVVAAGGRLYRLDEHAFHRAQPDLIVTQDLCHVCAVTPDQLARAIRSLPRQPRVLTLSPTTLEDMLTGIERIAEATGLPDKGQELARSLRQRLDGVRARTAATGTRPRVACLEWLAPLYVGGHWVPEMVDLAGGLDVLGSPGSPSRQVTWQDVENAKPDIVLVMPCGYSVARAIQELSQDGPTRHEWRHALRRWPHTYVVDAAAFFSRPGPRLVNGVELLAALLHPDPAHPISPTSAIQLGSAGCFMDTAS